MPEVSRRQVLAYSVHVQQLDRPAPDGDPAVLDLGVQDTGPDGAPWALGLRGGRFGPARPLKEAGLPVLEALDRIADTARDVVRRPMAKGEVSSERLAAFRGAGLAGFVP